MRRAIGFVMVLGCGVIAGGVGCGSSSDQGAPSSDAGAAIDAAGQDGAAPAQDAAPSDGGAVDSASEAGGPVTLLDTTPADGTLHVAVLSSMKLHFSGSLDAASVSATSVLLLAPNATAGFPATVAYDDATHTITITPKAALATNNTYRIATSSLKAKDGSPVANAALSFTTLYDTAIDEVGYDATGTTITAYFTYTHDANGRFGRRVTMAKGADGVFKTADDVPASYNAASFGNGSLRSINYTGAGPDATWFTSDDAIGSYTDIDTSVFGRTRTVNHATAGADGIWLNADDPVSTFYEIHFNAQGKEDTWTNFSGVGADGVPFTADDAISIRYVDTWTATSVQRVTYSGPGADGVWGTNDDVISQVTKSDLDAIGHVTALRFIDKGADGVWLTADDVTTSVWEYAFDAQGLQVKFRTHSSAGSDGIWLTADDTITSLRTYAYDANGAQSSWTGYAAGPDGVYRTADDIPGYVARFDTTL